MSTVYFLCVYRGLEYTVSLHFHFGFVNPSVNNPPRAKRKQTLPSCTLSAVFEGEGSASVAVEWLPHRQMVLRVYML